MRYDNTSEMQNVPVRDIKAGTYVKRISKDGTPQNKVYIRGEYSRSTRRYELIDAEDINRAVYVKPDSLVHIGFTY